MFDEPQTRPAPELVESEASREEEFELVIGRRQMAAIAFLGLVIVAVSSGGSYLAGKAMSSREESVQPLIKLEETSVAPMPMLEATIVPPSAVPPYAAPARPPALEAPLFAVPAPKAIYIQVGAVEKGVATVIAEGLRRHELNSFVAAGPNEKIFRVLIGPFPDAEGYQKAQRIVDQIGLASFARRYQQQ